MNKIVAFVSFALFATLASATGPTDIAPAQADAASPGSTAFCLFELPPDGDKRIWINLGIVQYVDLRPSELRIYFGGGNLGGGHEFRLPIAAREDGIAFMKRMQAAAASCGGVAAGPAIDHAVDAVK